MPTAAPVEVLGVEKSFPDRRRGLVQAVDGVTFRVPRGRIFGLLGANGAGKTTTLRILATSLEADAGEVRVAGYDARTQPREVRRRIGFLSGATRLYERSTARELLTFFGRMYGCAPLALEARIAELSAWLRMQTFLDRACGKLSTGQAQKVGIARCLVHDPEVLILDEPTSGLDILVARDVLVRIAEARDAGKTILLSTHVLHEVERLCDEVAILHRGRVLAAGTLEALRDQTGAKDLEEAFFQLLDHEGTEVEHAP